MRDEFNLSVSLDDEPLHLDPFTDADRRAVALFTRRIYG